MAHVISNNGNRPSKKLGLEFEDKPLWRWRTWADVCPMGLQARRTALVVPVSSPPPPLGSTSLPQHGPLPAYTPCVTLGFMSGSCAIRPR